MLEMLKERKAALEAQGKKGFTLMEMLIVIAIIAVLIAIAIPIFTAQLENSREATDKANLRSAYAELVSQFLTDGKTNSIQVPVTQTQAGWQSATDSEKSGDAIKIGTNLNLSAGDNTSEYVAVGAKTTGNYTLAIDSNGQVTESA